MIVRLYKTLLKWSFHDRPVERGRFVKIGGEKMKIGSKRSS